MAGSMRSEAFDVLPHTPPPPEGCPREGTTAAHATRMLEGRSPSPNPVDPPPRTAQ